MRIPPILSAVLMLLMTSCMAENLLLHANNMAQQAQLTQKYLTVGQFTLNTYSRINNPNKPIHIYIEGDGFAWVSKYQLSTDPTPKQALALQLASVDTAENVVYIARPCQFNQFETSTCDSAYWSNKRFAPEVIASMNDAVSYFAQQLKVSVPAVHLIAYSGGAAVAVLLTAQRCLKTCDIASIRTVAGNLDTELLNQTHHVSAMPESLNPINVAKAIQNIPQIHFVGQDDQRVPASIVASFMLKQTGSCSSLIKVKNVDHEHGWVENWSHLLQNTPKC